MVLTSNTENPSSFAFLFILEEDQTKNGTDTEDSSKQEEKMDVNDDQPTTTSTVKSIFFL